MTPLLLAALVAILSVQPTLRIERIDGPVTQIHTLSGATVQSAGAYGWVECTNGHVDRIVWNGNPGTLLHEALHGADCVDGDTDGSLLPHQPTEADPAEEWVGWAFTHPAEAISIMEGMK